MTKEIIRKSFLEKRSRLSTDEVAQLSLQLYHFFFSAFDLSFVKVLHTYLPIEKNREPDTWMIIDRVRREFPLTRIAVPKINSEGHMENIFFEGLHQLQVGKWGITEPKQGIGVEPSKVDLVLVPLLAVDVDGHRVGYGKGFYDRFLSKCRPDCKKIGLSLFEMIPPIEDVSDHDVRLDGTITPGGIHYY
jgi:5-formyltetrahydrofolate cyclo-ligase